MSNADLSFFPITELAPRIASGEVTPAALLEACIDRIEADDERVNAFITRTFDFARGQAASLEDDARRGYVRWPPRGRPISGRDPRGR